MTARTCAAPGCDNVVPPRPGRAGRRPIYCCPACRPSRAQQRVVVEIDVEADEDHDPGRDWIVRLRRGRRSMVVGHSLGRLSANAFAIELESFFGSERPSLCRQQPPATNAEEGA